MNYSQGYQTASREDQQAILGKASELVSSGVWTELVMYNLASDLDDRRPGALEIDSAKADATWWLSTLLSKEIQQDMAFSKLLLKLLFMKPYQ